MKAPILSTLLCFIAMYTSAQTISFDYILNQPEKVVYSYNTKKLPKEIFKLQCNFDEYDMWDSDKIIEIRKRRITKIVLCYSAYKELKTFNQRELNRKRLTELQKRFPEVFYDNSIEWQVVKQLGSDSSLTAAEGLFHGFLIFTCNRGPVLSSKAEVESIEKILASEKRTYHDTIVHCRDKVKRHRISTGKFMPILAYKKRKGIRYDESFFGFRRPEFIVEKEYYSRCDTSITVPSHTFSFRFCDTVVLKTLNNYYKNSTGNFIVVEDVTGSMYPYIAQTMMWRRMNIGRFEKYLFFNDGDSKYESEKMPGETGGLYYIQSNEVKDVENKAYEARMNGGGGDIPENNIEAILSAIDRCPECDTVLMIADNLAPVKDLELLDEVSKPVNIILCGPDNYIQISYVKIAQSTGGVIHTMNRTLDSLDEIKEHDIVEIGGQKFRYHNGVFELLSTR